MVEPGGTESGGKTGWIAKYGVPSLVLSVAVLVVQQQQQTFDRLQGILQSGYQFYSSGRTTLQYAGDGNRELSLLRIIGNAFPNVFCDVRQDMYERASKVDTPGGQDKDGRRLIDSFEIKAMYEGLEDARQPRRQEAADSVIGAWTNALPWTSKKSTACAPLNNPAAKGADENLLVDSTIEETDARQGKDVQTPMKDSAAADAAARAEKARETVAKTGGSAGPAPAAPPAASSTPAAPPPPTPALSDPGPAPKYETLPAPALVFFQIPSDSPEGRETAVSQGARSELAQYNYQVMRGVERVSPKAFAGSGPEVRYFGKAQEPAARQLKAYLDRQFHSEGLVFEIAEIGGKYKGMPPQNIEVWVPNPPEVRAATPAQRAQTAVQRPQ